MHSNKEAEIYINSLTISCAVFLEKFLKNNVMTTKVHHDDIVITKFSPKTS